MTKAMAIELATKLATISGEPIDVWQHVGNETTPEQSRFIARPQDVSPPKSSAWVRYAVVHFGGEVVEVRVLY